MTKNIIFPFTWVSAHFVQMPLLRLLLSSIGFGFFLLLARTVYTHELSFFFLGWNLFLAFIPFCLSYAVTLQPAWIKHSGIRIATFILWLLFIPNSFYMLTDLFHLYDSFTVPRWYDLLLILSFAWNAALLGILSVRHVEKIIERSRPYRVEGFFVYPVMFLNALGIYIGRYLRFNSWDVISNPLQLTADMMHLLMHPIYYKNGWAMIICFSFFLSIFYITLKKLSKTA